MAISESKKYQLKKTAEDFAPSVVLSILLGTAILSFGIYNIHQQVGITEGGILGMILLIHHWFGLQPSIISPILDALCYALGFRLLGKSFLKRSIAATISLAFFFWIWEHFPPMLPNLSNHPLLAALIGGLFVGVGVVFVVVHDASSGGDDALALVISKLTGWKISRAYMITDFTVLAISLSYIPIMKIIFSLITVMVSSMTIELLLPLIKKCCVRKPKEIKPEETESSEAL